MDTIDWNNFHPILSNSYFIPDNSSLEEYIKRVSDQPHENTGYQWFMKRTLMYARKLPLFFGMLIIYKTISDMIVVSKVRCLILIFLIFVRLKRN